jgi:hypothetical protein
VAAVALARRLAGILYAMWRDDVPCVTTRGDRRAVGPGTTFYFPLFSDAFFSSAFFFCAACSRAVHGGTMLFERA